MNLNFHLITWSVALLLRNPEELSWVVYDSIGRPTIDGSHEVLKGMSSSATKNVMIMFDMQMTVDSFSIAFIKSALTKDEPVVVSSAEVWLDCSLADAEKPLTF